MLNFKKAFDKVSHAKLRQKLQYLRYLWKDCLGSLHFYQITHSLLLVDGAYSSVVPVTSGCLKALFLVQHSSSCLSMTLLIPLTHKCGYLRMMLYSHRQVGSADDHQILQHDLDSLSDTWQMDLMSQNAIFYQSLTNATQVCMSMTLTHNHCPLSILMTTLVCVVPATCDGAAIAARLQAVTAAHLV